MSQELKGKTVLVTGGAHRVGRLICLSAAREGADIILHHFSSNAVAAETAEELSRLGVSVWLYSYDLSKANGIVAFIDTVWSEKPFDILVNSAAIFGDHRFEDTSLVDWERHLAVNLTAPFLLSKTFAAKLQEGQHGRIVNILDWRALRPGSDHFPYTISKAALAAMTRSLAISLAPRITVNGLALGAILPPADGAEVGSITKNIPSGRWAKESELGDAILFLLTGPEYITGEILHLDGGRHLV